MSETEYTVQEKLTTIRDKLRSGMFGQREVWERWLVEAATTIDRLKAEVAEKDKQYDALVMLVMRGSHREARDFARERFVQLEPSDREQASKLARQTSAAESRALAAEAALREATETVRDLLGHSHLSDLADEDLTEEDRKAERRARAVANVEPMREATEWRPIETAPKDGTRFLALHKSGKQTLAEITGPRIDHSTDQITDWDCYAVALRCSTQQALSEFTGWRALTAGMRSEDKS